MRDVLDDLLGWWRGLRRFTEQTGGSAGREDVAVEAGRQLDALKEEVEDILDHVRPRVDPVGGGAVEDDE